MYRTIRKSIASSISTFEEPEYFEWHKWLKSPTIDQFELEEIHTYLENTDHWIEVFPQTELSSHAIKMPKVPTYESRENHRFQNVKTGPVFFGFKRSSAIDVHFRFKNEVRKIFSLKEEKEKNPGRTTFKSIILKIAAKLNVPDTQDYLSSLKPIVLQYKMLDPKTIFKDSEKRKIYSVNFNKIRSTPKIFKVKALSFNGIEMPVYSVKKTVFPQIKIHSSKFNPLSKISVKQNNLADSLQSTGKSFRLKFDEEPNTKVQSKNDDPIIESILKPLNKRLINYNENLQKCLFDYQREGVDFLFNRDTALIADDLGLGKTLQAILALNKLFAEGKINSALIICPENEMGNWDESIFSENIQGWISHINKFTFQLTYNVIDGNRKQRFALWKKRADITLISYNKIFYDAEEQLVDKKILPGLDCIILDDISEISIHGKPKKLFDLLNPKYIWSLSNTASKEMLKDISETTGKSILVQNYLRRTRSEVSVHINRPIVQDFWLPMDENQKFEYEDALKTAQEQMYFLLESGNPLRFQANIFTILHKLNQISNFSEQKGISAKSELLQKHLKAISQSGEKVIIFSQYDKSGTKNINDILIKSGIKCLSFEPGLSTKEMEIILSQFKRDKTITALIVGMKGSKLKHELPDVKYVIHFDQWWNPATNWQTQRIISDNGRKSWEGEITFFNYRMKNSVDEKLQRLMHEKGLLNKNVLEYISQEMFANLIILEEWLDVLGVKPLDLKEQKIKSDEMLKLLSALSTDEMKTKVKSFLSALNFKDITFFDGKNDKEFLAHGSVQRNGKAFNLAALGLIREKVSKERVNEFVHESENKPNAGKIFIITTGTFEEESVGFTKPNVSLIDKNLLAKYLLCFNIVK